MENYMCRNKTSKQAGEAQSLIWVLCWHEEVAGRHFVFSFVFVLYRLYFLPVIAAVRQIRRCCLSFTQVNTTSSTSSSCQSTSFLYTILLLARHTAADLLHQSNLCCFTLACTYLALLQIPPTVCGCFELTQLHILSRWVMFCSVLVLPCQWLNTLAVL